jgi:hypothetical protein
MFRVPSDGMQQDARGRVYVSLMSVTMERYDLVQHGAVLATRELGRDVGRDAADELREHGALLLSFAGVDVTSPAFVHELIQPLRTELAAGDGQVLIAAGLNDDTKHCLELVLEHSKMVLGTLEDQHITLLGGNAKLQETLDEAIEFGAFNTAELAERLELKLPALHQRLNALIEGGVIQKSPDPTATRGKRGRYETPDVDAVQELAVSG